MKRTASILAAALAFTLTPALASPASAAYAPQGGRWQADGSGPTYHQGMRTTRPTQHALGQYQRALGVPITYRPDRATFQAVLAHQKARRWLRNTGRIDMPTSRSILAPVIEQEARRAGVSARLLCGHLWAESRLDPGAVGPGGIDLGVAQVVPRYNPGVNPWDIRAAIRNMAKRDATAIRRYGNVVGPVFYWNGDHARAWTPEAKAYRERIGAAPCQGFRA